MYITTFDNSQSIFLVENQLKRSKVPSAMVELITRATMLDILIFMLINTI